MLIQHSIAREEPTIPEPDPAPTESAPSPTHFTTDDKVSLFRRLFRGREDVYPQRWELAKGTSGYSPVCGNEWKSGICHKPRVKCGDCNQRQLLPVTPVTTETFQPSCQWRPAGSAVSIMTWPLFVLATGVIHAWRAGKSKWFIETAGDSIFGNRTAI